MPSVGVLAVTQNGDIGGAGISRYHALNTSSGTFTTADANAFASNLHTLYTAAAASAPTTITFTVGAVVQMIDVATGALVAEVPVASPPAAIPGTGVESYAAGTGARVYWHTAQIRNRRLMRGATFFCPITTNDYTTTGLISTVTTAGYVTACTSYLTNMTTDALTPVVYGRPIPKGTTNGVTGTISTATCGTTPSSLRSRRS